VHTTTAFNPSSPRRRRCPALKFAIVADLGRNK